MRRFTVEIMDGGHWRRVLRTVSLRVALHEAAQYAVMGYDVDVRRGG
jgi:hypothetical protein